MGGGPPCPPRSASRQSRDAPRVPERPGIPTAPARLRTAVASGGRRRRMGRWSSGPSGRAPATFPLEEILMRYMLLIGSDDKNAPPRPRAEMEAIVAGHRRFAEELSAKGKMIVGERLRPD